MKNRFLQLHFLTAYPPSNLNRDDLGRPKTAVVGGANRLRISSQCLKRTWRTSDIFQSKLENAVGKRTKFLGEEVYAELLKNQISDKEATKWAELIADKFGKLGEEKVAADDENAKKKADKKAVLRQLVHFSPQEQQGVDELVKKLIERKTEPTKEELESLPRKDIKAADIALFGRMLAYTPDYNQEAAAQVAHAITTHRVSIEDDFFAAVDDFNKADEKGSGHLGVHEFGAGLFYSYVCINRALLVDNLQGDEVLAKKTIEAFVEAATTTSPSGKQNSYAALSRASYVLAELGDKQPRSLSTAFFKPVQSTENEDLVEKSVEIMTKTREHIDRVYGKSFEVDSTLNLAEGSGSLIELITFSTGY